MGFLFVAAVSFDAEHFAVNQIRRTITFIERLLVENAPHPDFSTPLQRRRSFHQIVQLLLRKPAISITMKGYIARKRFKWLECQQNNISGTTLKKTVPFNALASTSFPQFRHPKRLVLLLYYLPFIMEFRERNGQLFCGLFHVEIFTNILFTAFGSTPYLTSSVVTRFVRSSITFNSGSSAIALL